MKTTRLNTFKQTQQSNRFFEPSYRASALIVAIALAASTVVFNSSFVNAQEPASNVADSPAGETVRNQVEEAGKAPSTPLETHPLTTTGKKAAAAAKPAVKPVEDKMSAARPKEVQDLPNFHKVTDYLYRGGEPTAKGMHELQKMGVKTLIDLRAKTEAAHDEEALAKKLGMKYINLTMTAEAPTKKQVETLLATIDSAKEKNEPVLVHCAHGSDRTGCMIGIWRVTRDKWSFDDTYKEMRKYWFGVKYDKLRNAVKERAAN
jgi:protein tyrosine phosphatase (PTP) superfamily phosphohydrolase (DUF442 family)